VDAATDRHVRAEQKRFCHVERSRDISYYFSPNRSQLRNI
jgi:hypothetical protein